MTVCKHAHSGAWQLHLYGVRARAHWGVWKKEWRSSVLLVDVVFVCVCVFSCNLQISVHFCVCFFPLCLMEM